MEAENPQDGPCRRELFPAEREIGVEYEDAIRHRRPCRWPCFQCWQCRHCSSSPSRRRRDHATTILRPCLPRPASRAFIKVVACPTIARGKGFLVFAPFADTRRDRLLLMSLSAPDRRLERLSLTFFCRRECSGWRDFRRSHPGDRDIIGLSGAEQRHLVDFENLPPGSSVRSRRAFWRRR